MPVLYKNEESALNIKTNRYSPSCLFASRLYMLTIVSFVVLCFAGGVAMAESGTLTFPDGSKYVGEHKDGIPNGQGTFIWPNGNKYAGGLMDGKFNGQGTYTRPNGHKYVGKWKEDKRNGQGTRTCPDCGKYEGEWKDDKFNGEGALALPDGESYVGEFKDGAYNGLGTTFSPDGNQYFGKFKDGKAVDPWWVELVWGVAGSLSIGFIVLVFKFKLYNHWLFYWG